MMPETIRPVSEFPYRLELLGSVLKNTLRDAADTVDTFDMVYTVEMVYTADMVHTLDMAHTVDLA